MNKPPFRADQVGSLLRPEAVVRARERREQGTISAAELTRIEDEAIEKLILRQEQIGLRCTTDGELRRATWAYDFLSGFEGLKPVPRAVPPQAQGKALNQTPKGMNLLTVVGRIRFAGNPLIEHFRFLRAHTRVTAKMTIPCPTMLVSASRDWRETVDRTVYPTLDALFEDLGLAYREAIQAFYDAGCRYLQLDDVNLAFLCDANMRQKLGARGDDPDALLRSWVKVLNTAIGGRPADLTVTTHICRGNFRSAWFAQGGYEAIADALFNQLDYDGYFLEYDTERAGGFEPLRFLPKGNKRVVLGLVTTKTGALESRDVIRQRVEAAARLVPLDQLCLSPQCGFASTAEGNELAEEEQWAKLALVVELAKSIWRDA
ncbi:MAG TPA: 5-methyltetrahydropteroyltriglutamate--homocysteine S-methyltransferase [Steroidobacteraceae bacterium]|nr:5-methyltetrahydropteroyltriglutamate--homocysteine S-methyltransferase [Steroidobacteraceae bacterium]